MPLYYQVANVLQARIFSGAVAPGALLGTEKDLSSEFGVSRITIRKAIEVLRRDGLLEAERGLGTFVSASARPVAPTTLHVFLDDILARAEALSVHELDRTEVPASREVAARLGFRAGAKVVRIRRRMVARDDADGVWITYFVPRDVWRRLGADASGSLLPSIDQLEGLRLTQGREVIRAVAADEETAALMQVAPGTVLLRSEREYRTADGRMAVFGWADRRTGGIPVRLTRARR